jgi:putative transposase
MERGRPKKAQIQLSTQEHADLQVLARSRSLPHKVVRRAQMILMSAEGYSNTAIAEHFGLTLPSAGHWRKRHLSQGIAGL